MLKLLGILDELEPSVQPAEQVWSWGNIYLPKPGKWPSQHIYLKINSGYHARKNPKQQYLKVVTSRSVMLHSAKSALMFTIMQAYLDNTMNRPPSAWESFNIISQKLGLFVLGVTHILNLPTACVILTQVGGWAWHSD